MNPVDLSVARSSNGRYHVTSACPGEAVAIVARVTAVPSGAAPIEIAPHVVVMAEDGCVGEGIELWHDPGFLCMYPRGVRIDIDASAFTSGTLTVVITKVRWADAGQGPVYAPLTRRTFNGVATRPPPLAEFYIATDVTVVAGFTVSAGQRGPVLAGVPVIPLDALITYYTRLR